VECIVPVEEIAEEDEAVVPEVPVGLRSGDRVTEGVPVPKL